MELELYAIQREDGKWFRPTGYGGGGSRWRDSMSEAKIYGKVGSARRQIGFWANQGTKCYLIKFDIAGYEVIDEEERLRKQAERKAAFKASEAERDAKRKLREAEANLENAKKQVELLKGKP